MPAVTVNGRGVMYETTGDGFPLILVPDASDTRHGWAPVMPLLGELCRVIAYAYDRLAPLRAPPPQLPLGSTRLEERLNAPERIAETTPTDSHRIVVARSVARGASTSCASSAA